MVARVWVVVAEERGTDERVVDFGVVAGAFEVLAFSVGAGVGDNGAVVVDASGVTALVVPAPVGLEPPQAASVANTHATRAPVRLRAPNKRDLRAGPAARVTRQR